MCKLCGWFMLLLLIYELVYLSDQSYLCKTLKWPCGAYLNTNVFSSYDFTVYCKILQNSSHRFGHFHIEKTVDHWADLTN